MQALTNGLFKKDASKRPLALRCVVRHPQATIHDGSWGRGTGVRGEASKPQTVLPITSACSPVPPRPCLCYIHLLPHYSNVAFLRTIEQHLIGSIGAASMPSSLRHLLPSIQSCTRLKTIVAPANPPTLRAIWHLLPQEHFSGLRCLLS